MSVLMSSGADWSNRMRKLSARAPSLDIFSDKLVLRDNAGWQITDDGRQLLASLDARMPEAPVPEHCIESDPVIAVPVPFSPPFG
jgi:hypothetical protein